MSNEDYSFKPGVKIGPYSIENGIGRGGFGEVYTAVHASLGRRVAIKTLRPEMASKADIRERFMREGQIAAKINHPNAVAITDVFEHAGSACLVMELLEGENLSDFLKHERRLSAEAIARWMLPVLAALDAAHRESIVHRDLKPANIFLHRTRDGVIQPKVLDFGISKVFNDLGEELTHTTNVLGTPQYMAPELLYGARNASPQSDQYALGVVMYVCASGQRPFVADSHAALALAVTQGQFHPPRAVCSDIPPSLEAIILRTMARDPAARFASMRHLGAELISFADPLTRMTWEPIFGAPSLAPMPPTTALPPASSSGGLAPSSPAHAPSSEDPTTLASVRRSAAPRSPQPRPRAWALPVALAVVVALGLSTVGAVTLWRHRDAAPVALAQPTPSGPPSSPATPTPAAPTPATPTPTVAPTTAAQTPDAAVLPLALPPAVAPTPAVPTPPATATNAPAAAHHGHRHHRHGNPAEELLPPGLDSVGTPSGTNAMPVVR